MKAQSGSTDTPLLFLQYRCQIVVGGQSHTPAAVPTGKRADPHCRGGMNWKAYWKAAISTYLSSVIQWCHHNLYSGSRSPWRHSTQQLSVSKSEALSFESTCSVFFHSLRPNFPSVNLAFAVKLLVLLKLYERFCPCSTSNLRFTSSLLLTHPDDSKLRTGGKLGIAVTQGAKI